VVLRGEEDDGRHIVAVAEDPRWVLLVRGPGWSC
jgi:hypothetical protein